MHLFDATTRFYGGNAIVGAHLPLAVGLALADEKTPHGPVEVLLTVDEERGLTGAAGVQAGFFDARTMINLDSEQDDAIFIGCAGGRDTGFTLKNKTTRAPKDSAGRKVEVPDEINTVFAAGPPASISATITPLASDGPLLATVTT